MSLIITQPFYYIRHGETDWNRQGLIMGQQDIPLNAHGLNQASEAGHMLKNIGIASIAASPLKRVLQTAETVADIISKPVTVIDQLKERGGGVREGRPGNENRHVQNWKEGGGYEGEEPVNIFEARVLQGLKNALNLPEPVLIVSHGGVYIALQRMFCLPRLALGNCIPLYHQPPEDQSQNWCISDLDGVKV